MYPAVFKFLRPLPYLMTYEDILESVVDGVDTDELAITYLSTPDDDLRISTKDRRSVRIEPANTGQTAIEQIEATAYDHDDITVTAESDQGPLYRHEVDGTEYNVILRYEQRTDDESDVQEDAEPDDDLFDWHCSPLSGMDQY